MSRLVYGPDIVTKNLVLALDAGNVRCYSGAGSEEWFDRSVTAAKFSVSSSAWNAAGSTSLSYFSWPYLHSKVPATDLQLSDSTGVTYFLVCRIVNSTGDWRTLTRSVTNDHHVIINNGTNTLGMYDNDAAGFVSTDENFDVSTIPGYGTSTFQFLYWRFASSSPYYKFSYNDTPGTIRGTITNSNGRYNRGFSYINGYQGGGQFFADIGLFYVYDRVLTDAELLKNYNSLKSRFIK